ncbi:MAG: glycosyltransferase family protein [Cyclobacteriaceae bacterium]
MAQSKSVLICVMDWGLGHATRSLLLIRELIRLGARVHIASSGNALQLLKESFPGLPVLELPGYRPVYSKSPVAFPWVMLAQAGKWLRVIRRERKFVSRYIDDHGIDLIISDNRYGCRNKKVYSVFIGHHLQLQDWWARPVSGWLQMMVRQFNECWIPDEADNRWTGVLSKVGWPHQFVGMMSVLSPAPSSVAKEYDVLVILSGPEPQRTIFQQLVQQQSSQLRWRVLIVGGRPDLNRNTQNAGSCEYRPFVHPEELAVLVRKSNWVICRSGYSTIMDMACLGAACLMVPTPGQSEQLVLARRLTSMNVAPYILQKDLRMEELPLLLEPFTGFGGLYGANRTMFSSHLHSWWNRYQTEH